MFSMSRSALSIDLENPEVERIKKDFEMYRLNKENEITNMQRKDQKFETENKRLRAELVVLQRTCNTLRQEKVAAIEEKHQALARAAAFEQDRDKVQRVFKVLFKAWWVILHFWLKLTVSRNLYRNTIGSTVAQCLTRDQDASPASPRCGLRHIYPSLVLVQPRKTRPCLTERLLMGRKESNQMKQEHHRLR